MRRGVVGAPALGAFALVAALVTGGCQYLLGFDPMAPYPSFDPEAPFPGASPLARYPTGSATIAIDGGETISLDRVRTPGSLDATFGADVTIGNADGWYVRVYAFPTGVGLGSGGSVTLDRITGTEHWTTADPSRCIVTIETADATALRGTATCRGLRWSDAVGGFPMTPESAYIEGQDPFDAEVTFEATGTGTSSS